MSFQTIVLPGETTPPYRRAIAQSRFLMLEMGR
jgi:hypothetical protein